MSVFAQYIYSLPNSTYLLILLNISNYFLNNNLTENYLLSTYLTASSMTQARLFIQAWELFNKIQFIIIQNKSQLFFLKYLFDSNTNSLISSDDNRTSYFLAKVELLKAICMYEYGQTNLFLESLKSSLNIFYKGDCSGLKASISWSKHSEICYNKVFIQNYLGRSTEQLVEFLFLLLKDKSEIVLLYSLKTIEFLFDYHIQSIAPYVPKLLKVLFKLLAPLKKSRNSMEKSNEEINSIFQQLKSAYLAKNVYFAESFVENYMIDLEVKHNNLRMERVLKMRKLLLSMTLLTLF